MKKSKGEVPSLYDTIIDQFIFQKSTLEDLEKIQDKITNTFQDRKRSWATNMLENLLKFERHQLFISQTIVGSHGINIILNDLNDTQVDTYELHLVNHTMLKAHLIIRGDMAQSRHDVGNTSDLANYIKSNVVFDLFLYYLQNHWRSEIVEMFQ